MIDRLIEHMDRVVRLTQFQLGFCSLELIEVILITHLLLLNYYLLLLRIRT